MKFIYFLMMSVLLFSCKKEKAIADDDANPPGNNQGQQGNGQTGDKEDSVLLDLINLDYPGLEEVKTLYQGGETHDAAVALLKYYRERVNVTDPRYSLVNVTVTEGDISKANYALEDNRFYVRNYFEDQASEMPYSVSDGKGGINWSFEPAGADNEYQNQLNRHQWFPALAKMYWTTKDEKYFFAWRDVYDDWIKNSPIPANGPSGGNNNTWRQLEVAERLSDQTQLFEYFKISPNFTPEWLSEFLLNFAAHADFLVKYPYSGGNILISQASALTFAGTLYPEFKQAEQWRNNGLGILEKEIKEQFLPDGMHEELDLSYHIGTISNFYDVIRLTDENKEIVGGAGSDFKQYLHKAARIVMNFTYPNYFTAKNGFDQNTTSYLVPGFNDTRQDSWTKNVLNKNFKKYSEMFPEDPELRYMATYGQQGQQPDVAPELFTPSGYYVLRNGWDKSSTMFIHSNNYSDKPIAIYTHNQPDNGTFELYHDGRNFFPDAGVFIYTGEGDNTQRAWYRQTRVHNTLTLNEGNITAEKGTLVSNGKIGETEVIVTENQGYNGLKHRRYIFFVDQQFFVLVDEGTGTATGTVNLNFNLCEGSDSEVVLDTENHSSYTDFPDHNNMQVKTFSDDGTLTMIPFAGKVSYQPGIENDRKAYAINLSKNTSAPARYITIIYFDKKAGEVPLNARFNQGFDNKGVDLDVEADGVIHHLKYSF